LRIADFRFWNPQRRRGHLAREQSSLARLARHAAKRTTCRSPTSWPLIHEGHEEAPKEVETRLFVHLRVLRGLSFRCGSTALSNPTTARSDKACRPDNPRPPRRGQGRKSPQFFTFLPTQSRKDAEVVSSCIPGRSAPQKSPVISSRPPRKRIQCFATWRLGVRL
jgi:hypothetical protein